MDGVHDKWPRVPRDSREAVRVMVYALNVLPWIGTDSPCESFVPYDIIEDLVPFMVSSGVFIEKKSCNRSV